MSAPPPVVVVGAGIAGLACARELARAGRPVSVLERARGVGGRCATHRLDGQPFDIGPAFLHGRDPDFLRVLREVPAPRVEGWPREIRGAGAPCQPEAFRTGEQRLVFAEGLTAFPKHLAEGLPVHAGRDVTALRLDGGRVQLTGPGGDVVEARQVVLALAPEQVLRLLPAGPEAPRAVASLRAVVEMAVSEAALALAAIYPPGTAVPGWDVWYPEASRVLQILVHDSAKRAGEARVGLVLQARPAWSREHLDDPDWPRALLDEAGRVAGAWAAAPSATHAHRWRYARSDLASELAGPVLLQLPGGQELGVCGDRFARGGGAEAAWISGRELGRRLAAQEVA